MAGGGDPDKREAKMSKLHMRARKLDYTRRLHVYRSEEVLDLDDQTQFARSVPVVATGVEKEEEEVCTRITPHMLWINAVTGGVPDMQTHAAIPEGVRG